MKLTSKILGAIVLAILLTAMVFSFVNAGIIYSDLKTPAENIDDSGDIIYYGLATTMVFVRIFSLMGFILIGFSITIYFLLFMLSYIKRFKNSNSIEFNKGSIWLAGFILIVIVITSIMIKKLTWLFAIIMVLNVAIVVYSIISNLEQKSSIDSDENDTIDDDKIYLKLEE